MYHLYLLNDEWRFVQAGFFGVDVFFVVSGFLISQLVLKDLNNNTFSFLEFYERRVRRLLPALILVLSTTTVLAWLFLLPANLVEYSFSAISGTLFLANFWFSNLDHYFAPPLSSQPLLHLWSLAVEEQFYLVFPALLFLIARCAKTRASQLVTILCLLALSYSFNLFGVGDAADRFFYLHTRAWEFLCGTALAVYFDARQAPTSRHASTLTGMGLLLIIAPAWWLDSSANHPGAHTLLPVVGTVLVIWFSSQDGIFPNLLKLAPLVYVGKISYSLYLWHFPLFVFGAMALNSSVTSAIALLSTAFLLSALTLHFVETPFRDRKRLPAAKASTLLLIGTVLTISSHYLIVRQDGVPSRLGQISDIFEKARAKLTRQENRICLYRTFESVCEYPNPNADKNLFLVGDSHAQTLAPVLQNAMLEDEFSFTDYSLIGCMAIYGTVRLVDGNRRNRCADRAKKLNDFLITAPPSTIVYMGRLTTLFEGKVFDNEEGGVEPVPRKFELTKNKTYITEDIAPRDLLVEMIQRWLAIGHEVVLVYPVPEVGWDVPKTLWQQLRGTPVSGYQERFKSLSLTTSYAVYKKRNRTTINILNDIADHPRLIRVYPDKIFCSEKSGRCITHNMETIFYSDDDHLSQAGAALIFNEFRSEIFRN